MRTMQMPARMENLRGLMRFIAGCAAEAGLALETQNRMELVAEEALVNIIKYAYSGTTGDIDVRCLRENAPSLTIEIRDEGPSFNPLQSAVPDVTAGLDEREPGGLGIYFMSRMTDGLSYRREHSSNILSLTFLDR